MKKDVFNYKPIISNLVKEPKDQHHLMTIGIKNYW